MRHLIPILLPAVVLAGCSGGGSGGSTSAVSLPSSNSITIPSITALMVTPTSASLPSGTSLQLQATALLSDGNHVDVTGAANWSSNDPGKLTVNSGLARALASSGAIQVTANFSGQTASATIQLSDAVLRSMTITPASLTLPSGVTSQLTASGSFSDGLNRDITQDASWTSSNTTAATITNTGNRGLVKAVTPGSSIITAQLGGLSAQRNVSVSSASLLSLELEPAVTQAPKGVITSFAAKAVYTDASRIDVTEQSDWSSNTPGTASVSNSTGSKGKTIGLAVGPAIIQSQFQGMSSSASLQVNSAELVRLELTPTNSTVAKGLQQQMTANGTYTDGAVLDLTQQVTWGSSNASGAQISNAAGSEGLVTAQELGQVELTAGLDSISAATNLTVGPPVAVAINLFPSKARKAQGESVDYTVNATLSDGSQRDVTADANLSVVDPNAASLTSNHLLARSLAVTQVKADVQGLSSVADLVISVERISQSDASTGQNAPEVQGNGSCSMSRDGRYVAFNSAASNLDAGDTNGVDDVFVRDRDLQTTRRVSFSSSGAQGELASRDPSLSWDGTQIAFDSYSRNLVSGQLLDLGNVFLRDLVTQTTRLAYTFPSSGTSGNAALASLSADAQVISFIAQAPALGYTPTSVWVSTLPGRVADFLRKPGGGGLTGSIMSWVSADGRTVAFLSSTSEVVPITPTGLRHILVFDRTTLLYERIDVKSDGSVQNGSAVSARISGDGSVVAFACDGTDLGSNTAGSSLNVFVRDRSTGTTAQVNSSDQAPSGNIGLSASGRYVVYGAGQGGRFGTYVYDRETGQRRLADVSATGSPANAESRACQISPDGRIVTFQSNATNLFNKDNGSIFDQIAVLNPFLLP